MKYIFHIGFHKTGTTFLQNNIYPNINDIDYLPRYACPDVLNSLIYHSDYHSGKTLFLLKPYLTNKEILLISYEGLVGQPFYPKENLSMRVVERIASFENVKIIITIRNQVSIIDSLYRQFVQQGGSSDISEFIDEQKGIFKWEYCNYFPLIKKYVNLLGRDHVLLITQEQMMANKEFETGKILNFIRDDNLKLSQSDKGHGNVSMSNFSIKVMSFLNRFGSSNINGIEKKGIYKSSFLRMWLQHRIDPYILSKISKKRIFLSDYDQKRIKSYYSKTNMRLEEEFNLSLKELGYY